MKPSSPFAVAARARSRAPSPRSRSSRSPRLSRRARCRARRRSSGRSCSSPRCRRRPPAPKPAALRVGAVNVARAVPRQGLRRTGRTSSSTRRTSTTSSSSRPRRCSPRRRRRRWPRRTCSGAWSRRARPPTTATTCSTASSSELYGDARDAAKPAAVLAITFYLSSANGGDPRRALVARVPAARRRSPDRMPDALARALERGAVDDPRRSRARPRGGGAAEVGRPARTRRRPARQNSGGWPARSSAGTPALPGQLVGLGDPAAAHRLVGVGGRREHRRAHRGERELGGEQRLLGLQHGRVGRVAAVVLQLREARVVLERRDQALLRRELLLELLVRDERVVDVGERVLDRELVVEQRRLLRGFGLRDLAADRAEREDRPDDLARRSSRPGSAP